MNPVKRLVRILLFLILSHLSIAADTITLDHSIKDNGHDVIVSPGKIFALGFFSPGSSRNRYVGIWYYQVPEQTVVWVANRENPINDTSGILSIDSRGNLVLFQKNQTLHAWSTNISITGTRNSNVAQLLDSGNLVLLQNDTKRSVLWQSFDYPTNTFLPFMKVGISFRTGLNRVLTSWKSPDDPGIGNYSLSFNPSGFPQLYMYKGSSPWWRAGSWTGQRLSGVPEIAMDKNYIINTTFVNNDEEVSITNGLKSASMFTRMITTETGMQERYTWNNETRRWIEFWSGPKEQCDFYLHCGPNSYCNPDENFVKFECTCFPGFEPKSPQGWSIRDGAGGCVRKRGFSTCRNGEGFAKVGRVKVPDTSKARVDMSLGLQHCKDKCLRNCSCVAYASAYSESNGGIGCLTWHGELLDARTYTDAGQDLYIRVDADELAHYTKKGLQKKEVLAVLIVSTTLMIFIVVVFLRCFWRRQRRDNRLGQGGFGPVYKGMLNGKEIAVKRLSKSSGQGMDEFKNEVTLIAKLQHRNLVRILGCCIEKEEKMLVYEYMPNKSLDCFIFDERKRSLLDWGRRFEILYGIARAMVYLHQDSRLRIIHRDLKASNILLDANMNPKISDFGMARIFGGDQVEANTNRIVGTYGYMAPEYAMQGHFSIKSDVYSFGVLLIEIITGRRNSGYYLDSPTLNLIGHVWELWRNDKAREIIDLSLEASYPVAEVLRCIQIGLLCVQDSAVERPKMSVVVAMLGNDASLPSPKQPAFIIKKTNKQEETSSNEGAGSINKMTLTLPRAR
ncbi:hypothetical protein DITRI_Ditri19aG0024700 [Diplodiscus trichospermus]